MELMNNVGKFVDVSEQGRAVVHEALEAAVLMLAPITPHICHSLWQELGNSSDVLNAPWPSADESAMVKSSQQIVVQVNGKVRAKLDVAVGLSKDALEELALNDENVQRFTEGSTIRKVIVVPNKLVNIVAN